MSYPALVENSTKSKEARVFRLDSAQSLNSPKSAKTQQTTKALQSTKTLQSAKTPQSAKTNVARPQYAGEVRVPPRTRRHLKELGLMERIDEIPRRGAKLMPEEVAT